MAPKLLLIHGRGQASTEEVAQAPERLEAHIIGRKREWLGGLAKGLFLAGLSPILEPKVLFPFYGNAFASSIRAFEAAGGRRPELEILATEKPADDPGAADMKVAAVAETKAAALLDAAASLGFDAERELSYSDPAASEELAARATDEELGWGDALRVPVLRAALQFVSRKTGAPAVIIERFLEDVAYYLEMKDMRELVLGLVEQDLRRALPGGGDLVVVGHSLGSIVAYDLLTRLGNPYQVLLFVTAGSPLGFPIVKDNLLGKAPGQRPAVPAIVPEVQGAWLNAYDVLDVVALIHPLSGSYDEGVTGQLSDEQTHNPSGPHAIDDYLADPDVAEPVGRHMGC